MSEAGTEADLRRGETRRVTEGYVLTRKAVPDSGKTIKYIVASGSRRVVSTGLFRTGEVQVSWVARSSSVGPMGALVDQKSAREQTKLKGGESVIEVARGRKKGLGNAPAAEPDYKLECWVGLDDCLCLVRYGQKPKDAGLMVTALHIQEGKGSPYWRTILAPEAIRYKLSNLGLRDSIPERVDGDRTVARLTDPAYRLTDRQIEDRPLVAFGSA